MVTEKDIERVEQIQKVIRMTNVRSLNEIVSDSTDDASDTELGDMIISDEPSVDEIVNERFRSERLRNLLSELPPREQMVLLMRYGFDGKIRTLEEIGQCFNVTRERIRQIELKAMRMIRRKLYLNNIYKSDDL